MASVASSVPSNSCAHFLGMLGSALASDARNISRLRAACTCLSRSISDWTAACFSSALNGSFVPNTVVVLMAKPIHAASNKLSDFTGVVNDIISDLIKMKNQPQSMGAAADALKQSEKIIKGLNKILNDVLVSCPEVSV